jgi:1-acyl-sn-glycerol-3-phosphate acyltransferase
VVLALKTGAPIVPIVFHGARERLPWRAVCVRPGRITARLCRAIHTRGLTYADRDAVIAQLAEVAQRELARVPAERHEANSSDAKHGIELQANRALNW